MSAKSLNEAQEAQNALSKRFATVGAVSFDTDGEPYFLIGAGTAGTQSAIVKYKTYQPLGVDGVGLTPRAFTPVTCQVVLETSTIANTPLLTGANDIALLGELAHRGNRIELYMTANTTAVSTAGITTANLKATFDPDLKYKLMDSQ